MEKKVALVKCLTLPEPDPDAEVTIAGLQSGGIDAEWVGWDDPSIDWSNYGLALLRATWNYYEDEPAFRKWVTNTAKQVPLLNSRETVLGNLHKSYLLTLEAKGVPIVPTRLIRREGDRSLPLAWERFVVKPAVSAGSYLTEAFTLDQRNEAEQFLARVLERGDALVQKFMDSVDQGGEANFIHIDGFLTHGIVKRPRFSQDEESASEAIQPDSKQRSVAKKVMSTLEKPCLYARVDLMRDGDEWLLSELELIEPSLFFLQYPPALTRFVESVRTALA